MLIHGISRLPLHRRRTFAPCPKARWHVAATACPGGQGDEREGRHEVQPSTPIKYNDSVSAEAGQGPEDAAGMRQVVRRSRGAPDCGQGIRITRRAMPDSPKQSQASHKA